ncbi:MAG: PAS domain-containing protein [Rickettsiales bacterium]|nr:PAS domain-containing protein [Rickettsiales bacterium]
MFRYFDVNNLQSATQDFVRRKRHGSVWRAFLMYLAILLIVLSYGFYRHYHSSDVILIILLTVAITTLILHALYSIQKSLDLIMAVEFQNALFTSALNLRMDFTIIMQRNGSVVYVDSGFRELFPEIRTIDDKVLDYLTTNLQMDERQKDKFFLALRNYDYEQLVVELFKGNGEYDKFMLYLSPIPRPQGFFMIQARKYVAMRNAADVTVAKPESDKSYSKNVLDALPQPAYIISDSGILLDCNDRLAELLGYKDHQSCLSAVTQLSDVVFETSQLLKNRHPQNYEGSADFKTKDGGLRAINLQQYIMLDNGKLAGALGLVKKAS